MKCCKFIFPCWCMGWLAAVAATVTFCFTVLTTVVHLASNVFLEHTPWWYSLISSVYTWKSKPKHISSLVDHHQNQGSIVVWAAAKKGVELHTSVLRNKVAGSRGYHRIITVAVLIVLVASKVHKTRVALPYTLESRCQHISPLWLTTEPSYYHCWSAAG